MQKRFTSFSELRLHYVINFIQSYGVCTQYSFSAPARETLEGKKMLFMCLALSVRPFEFVILFFCVIRLLLVFNEKLVFLHSIIHRMQEHLSHIPLNLNSKLSSLPVQIFCWTESSECERGAERLYWFCEENICFKKEPPDRRSQWSCFV